MKKNKVQKNIFNDSRNDKLIYDEACKSHEQQQRDIEHLNNKFNWVIAVNVFAIGFILKEYKTEFTDFIIIALLFFLISFIFCLMSLWARTYRRGPKLAGMFEKINWNYEKMLHKTNKSLIKNVDFNHGIVRELKFFLKLAISFLICGFIILIFNFLTV